MLSYLAYLWANYWEHIWDYNKRFEVNLSSYKVTTNTLDTAYPYLDYYKSML